MRRLVPLALAAALAGCTVDVEGAACADDANCPAGQRCGHDRTCSEAAAACPGEICAASECDGQLLRTCVPAGAGPCAAFVETTCSSHQACNAVAASCDCAPTSCLAGVAAYCAGAGELVTCATEPATGCRYEAAPTPCAPGQACGGAPTAACACPAPGAGVGEGCASPGATSCAGTGLLQCALAATGSPCSVWAPIEDCAASGLVCSSAGAAACACPPLAASPRVLHADPAAPRRAGLTPNGDQAPPCRYATLGAALAAAAGGETVKAIGYGGAAVLFTEGPLTVPAGVTLTTADATPTPANYVLEVQGAGAEGARLEAGAALAGFTVRKGTDGPPLAARVLGSSPAGRPSLLSVRVDALGSGGAFLSGIRIEGTGAGVVDAVTLQDVGIREAAGVGLEVVMDTVGDTATVADAKVEGNGVGIKLAKGHLTLTHPTVKGSAAEGINADIAATGTARLTVLDGLVHGNGTVGLWCARLAGLAMERTQICGNVGSNRTLSGETRKVGGIYALGNAPAAGSLAFAGNAIHDNGGDQVFVGAGTGWNLSAPSCAAGVRNVVVGYVDVGSVGVSEIGAVVGARNWEWATASTPEPGVDFYVSSQGGSIDAVGTGGDFCLPPSPANPPACPP